MDNIGKFRRHNIKRQNYYGNTQKQTTPLQAAVGTEGELFCIWLFFNICYLFYPQKNYLMEVTELTIKLNTKFTIL